MKRIVLFVEGAGEVKAAPILVRKILSDQNAWDSVFLDEIPFRVGHVNKLYTGDFSRWKGWLKAAAVRGQLGGVLLLLDGDIKQVDNKEFCAAHVAYELCQAALDAGAGEMFSVAVVFAKQEYESWLLTNLENFAGIELPDGNTVKEQPSYPHGSPEETPRDAKGFLSDQIIGGYKPTRHQAYLTSILELEAVRRYGMRSFQRLEKGIEELVRAARSGVHIVSPCKKT